MSKQRLMCTRNECGKDEKKINKCHFDHPKSFDEGFGWKFSLKYFFCYIREVYVKDASIIIKCWSLISA